jgi:DNA ligase-4
MYRLNERNDDWIKVKPEYMSEFGESLDCVVVGGYYGSGHRGGAHSSFLCALIANKKAKRGDTDYEKCLSFFKVGGGFSRDDYASIRGRTEGKWQDWDARRPPPIIELGGHAENRQHERPDQWIHPSDSIVLECKAASVETTDRFRTTLTLRFPRFKQLRTDKNWDQALSYDEFMQVKYEVEREHDEKEKEFKIEQSRRKKARTEKKPLVVAGANGDDISTPYAGPASKLFDGLSFYIMTDQTKPIKKSKAELEALVKANGGKIVQRDSIDKTLIVVADKRLAKVSSLEKRDTNNIVKPVWIHDCIRQNEVDIGTIPYLLPFEPNRHMFYLLDNDQIRFEEHVDENGDSYTRDIVDVDEMRDILNAMPKKFDKPFDNQAFLDQLEDHNKSFSHLRNYMFSNVKIAVQRNGPSDWELRTQLARNYMKFGGGEVASDTDDENVTHRVVPDDSHDDLDATVKTRGLERTVGVEWVDKCWEEGTRVDEERFQWG